MSSPSSSNDPWVSRLAQFLDDSEDLDALLVDLDNQTIAAGGESTPQIKRLNAALRSILSSLEEVTSTSVPNDIDISQVGSKTLLRKKGVGLKPHQMHWRDIDWPAVDHHHHAHDWRPLAKLTFFCAFFGILAYLTDRSAIFAPSVSMSLYFLSMACGGWDAAQDVSKSLPKGKLDIHFLMLAVAVGATAIGALLEGALLLFLFSLSGTLEHFAQYRTQNEIRSLFKTAPKKVTVIDLNGEEKEYPIDLVTEEHTILVRPGQMVPVDAEVIHGESAVDESNLTGESVPVSKRVGDMLASGTLNEWGVLTAKVLRPASESSLQKIIRLIAEAQHLKAPSQRFTDYFGTPYTYMVLALVTIMFFVWWLVFDFPPFSNTTESYSAFYRAMTLLVVASPCALVLSIPSAILASIAWGASRGILFRGGVAIEKLSSVDTVALDKTGTLTTGDLKVHSVESFPAGRETEVLQLAYSLERQSHHPIAHAIVAHAKKEGIAYKAVSAFKSLTGAGLQGTLENEARCLLGRRSLLESGPLKDWVKDLPPAKESSTEVWVVYKDLLGRVLLQDTIRKESKPVLEKLKNKGLKTVMLTGDRREAAMLVAKQIGIQEVRSGLTPEDKVSIIHQLEKDGKKVAMVGDGVNDAPSLAAAYVSVAMGARGSDAALEQSEIVLMNDRIDNFYEAFNLSTRAKRIIQQNLAISLASVGIMVVAGITLNIPLTLGVITHEGSTVFVCLNSLRLLYNKV